MCGIIGTSNILISAEIFNQAHRSIFHRGPDNYSFVVDENFIFGHARLSIVDLDERSNQPFIYQFEDKKITVVFNGEIYNFQEIKKLLELKGYIFKTTSDTEVLCASYLEWGERCFDYFQGMWAVVLYDHSDNLIVIARDRVGKKPFYFNFENGVLNFASSLWGVCVLSNKFEVSSLGLQLYFALGFTPDNFSIIEGVNKLTPGKVFVFKSNKGNVTVQKEYNSVLVNFDENKSIYTLINRAVKKRIFSDVPIATLMSGGVDSTIVTKFAKKANAQTKAYFVDFKDKELSEFYWADYLSKRNKIELNRVYLKYRELEEAFVNYPEVYEEPFADYSGIPSIAIFKKVAENYKVVLTGDGGDELFYGYPHYLKKMLLRTLIKVNEVVKIENFFNDNVRSILNGGLKAFEGNYLKNHAILTPFAFEYINQRFNGVYKNEKSFSKSIIQYDREFNNLPEKYLVKTDRASMFYGVEVRSPFLDEVLLSKIKKTSVWKIFTPKFTKLFLKITFFKTFGPRYFLSKKKGFTPPLKKLRKNYFKEEDFNFLKEWLKINANEFFKEVIELDYERLKKDKILFDRFFFFYLWLKKSKFEYYSKLL